MKLQELGNRTAVLLRAALLRATALALKPTLPPGIPRGLQMRQRLAPAAPGDAPRERCFERGSALPERANGDAPPVSTDPLPPIPGPAPTWIPLAPALGFSCISLGPRSSDPRVSVRVSVCSCLPGLQTFCFSVFHAPSSRALKFSQACGTSSGVQMRNIYIFWFYHAEFVVGSHYPDLCFQSFGSSRCVPICSLASAV